MLDPTDPVECLPDQDDPEYWSLMRSAHECKFGGPRSTMNFWALSAHSERITLGVKMRSTAAFLSMPNKDGIIMGGKTARGFNENTMRGYPLWLPLTTQVSDIVMRDEDILRAKGGRHVLDNSQEILDADENREAVRKSCAPRHLDGNPDTEVIDSIRENFPACTLPLSRTSPTYITPEIMRNRQYAKEYLEHVALIRELLDQSSLSTNPALLSLSNNRLFQSLSGLLTGASNCTLTGEPIPVWNLVRVLRMGANAEFVRQTTMLMNGRTMSITVAPGSIKHVET